MFALCSKIAKGKLIIKHTCFFSSLPFNDLHPSTVTEPTLEVPSSNECLWKGPSFKNTSQMLNLTSGQLPTKYPLVSQWPMFMKTQYLLSHYMHWKDRLIQVIVQLPHLRALTFLWSRQPFASCVQSCPVLQTQHHLGRRWSDAWRDCGEQS